MINDKKMEYLRSENGFDYYLFQPSLFRQYYNKTEPWTSHRSALSHKLHMLFYFLRRGYHIIYIMHGDEVVSYIVYTYAGTGIVEGTAKDDIYTIFVTTNPKYRKMGFASKIVHAMLYDIGINYRRSFKTIAAHNTASLKAAAANGYTYQGDVVRKGLLKRTVFCDTSSEKMFMFEVGN